jgi:hypothetical protein
MRFLSKPIMRILLMVAAGLAVTAGILQAIGPAEQPVSVSAEQPPRINITRSDYERALATWQAQKIEEYEITLR